MSEKILFFNPVLKERIWGGTDLSLMYQKKSDVPLGEAWILSGHKEGETTVMNGKYQGKALNDLYLTEKQLFGESKYPKFPLLIKIIDAKEDLSVQVHPDDTHALKYHNDFGKNECWYILEATKDAQIIYGHKAQDINELTSMVAQKQWPQLLKYKNVSKGDFYFVPVGTVHAILKGIKVLEIQQSSDVTYRLYDYDRVDRNGKKRDLHLKEALPVITYHNQSNRANLETNHMIQRLVSNQYFTVDKIKLDGSLILHGNNTYSIIYTNEDLEIEIDHETYPLKKYHTCIATALTKSITIKGQTEVFITREKATDFKKMYTIET